MQPPQAYPHCLGCGQAQLQPLLWIAETGLPHDLSGHHIIYTCRVIFACPLCCQAQLESYSHDCWSHDEDWDMYWWYLLDPNSTQQLCQLMGACPAPLSPTCPCALHQALRPISERLYGGIRHATSSYGQVQFARLRLQLEQGQPTFKLWEEEE